MSALPFAPTPCTFDTRALFTDGEFPCFQSPNRCLLLFSDGEFPRALADVAVGGPGGQQPGVGNARRQQRRYKPQVWEEPEDEEAIILSLLFADDDDDWW